MRPETPVSFQWGYFAVHVMIAAALLLFVLAWLAWLWFMVCRPAGWRRWVEREHAAMRSLGLPDRLSQAMFAWQVGWPMKAVMAVTILMAFCALHFL
jgi:hypothetical protein